MTTWIRKIKQLLIGFLSTEDDKYIITDKGLKLVAFDRSFINSIKSITSFGTKAKTNSLFTNKPKS